MLPPFGVSTDPPTACVEKGSGKLPKSRQLHSLWVSLHKSDRSRGKAIFQAPQARGGQTTGLSALCWAAFVTLTKAEATHRALRALALQPPCPEPTHSFEPQQCRPGHGILFRKQGQLWRQIGPTRTFDGTVTAHWRVSRIRGATHLSGEPSPRAPFA